MSGQQYYTGQTSAQLRVALATDIPALYSSIAAPAAPSALVGLAAIPGAAITFMPSDAAPALDVSITPTWTGAHTFAATAGTSVTVGGIAFAGTLAMLMQNTSTTAGQDARFLVNAGSTSARLFVANQNNSAAIITNAPTGAQAILYTLGSAPLLLGTSNALRVTIAATGAVTIAGNFGVNGNAPPAQPTGYGTPTGGAHQASFAAGSITLPNLAAAVAQLIIELKSYGLIAA